MEQLRAVEARLNIKLPKDYKEYSRLGLVCFGSTEIYGAPQSADFTLSVRADWELPNDRLVIGFDGGVNYYVMKLDDADGSEVWRWRPGVSTQTEPGELVAGSFIEHFEALLDEEVEFWDNA
jgi:hypothetical protein